MYIHSIKHAVKVKAYQISSLRGRISRIQKPYRVHGKLAFVDIVKFLPEFSVEHELNVDEATASKVSKLNVQIPDITIIKDFYMKTVV